jgi:hypothetical protein
VVFCFGKVIESQKEKEFMKKVLALSLATFFTSIQVNAQFKSSSNTTNKPTETNTSSGTSGSSTKTGGMFTKYINMFLKGKFLEIKFSSKYLILL